MLTAVPLSLQGLSLQGLSSETLEVSLLRLSPSLWVGVILSRRNWLLSYTLFCLPMNAVGFPFGWNPIPPWPSKLFNARFRLFLRGFRGSGR
ncbi:hypothetical protein ACS0TY_023960 [Phlomoides rotata]